MRTVPGLRHSRVAVVLAPRGAATLRDLVQARAIGPSPVVVLRESVAQQASDFEALVRRLFGDVVVCSEDGDPFGDLRVDGVAAFADSELVAADGLRHRLGLPGGIPLSSSDKLVQRRRLVEHGLSRLDVAAVDTAADLIRGVRAVGLPAVLKPRRGANGDRVSVLRSERDVKRLVSAGHRLEGCMVEGYIAPAPDWRPAWLADHVSVEAMSTGSVHSVIEIVGKLPVAHIPSEVVGGERICLTGSVLPAPLPSARREQAADLAAAALTALGVTWGLTHTEVRFGAAGPEVIEVNCRLGGHVAGLMRRRRDFDAVAAELALACRSAWPAPAEEPSPEAIAQVYVPLGSANGSVESHVTATDLRALPGVSVVEEIARRGAARTATEGIACIVVLSAGSPADLPSTLDGFLAAAAGLFAADGVGRLPWLRRVRAALAAT